MFPVEYMSIGKVGEGVCLVSGTIICEFQKVTLQASKAVHLHSKEL